MSPVTGAGWSVRADAAMPLLVLATYRDTEPSRSSLLREVVTGLARRDDVLRLELAGLPEPDVAAMLAGADRSPSLAPRVRALTEGNPFFVAEVLRALGEGDELDPRVTPRVRDVVRWRLGRLPRDTVDVLAAAAVAGPEFDMDVVADTLRLGADATLLALEAAERARLVRTAGRLDRFSFAHALVRQTIVENLPGGRRARLHARIALALERAAQTRPVAAAELAGHFAAAGTLADAGRALHHARRAGEEAAERLAFDVAARHFDDALCAWERLPDAPLTERLDLAIARGRALRLGGDERAQGVLRGAADAAQAAGDGARMAAALLPMGLDRETSFLAEDDEMVALLRRALDLLPTQDSPARARLLGFLAVEALYSLPHPERRAMVEEALAMARRLGDPAILAGVLTSHGWTVLDPARRRERIALADELVRVGREGLPYAESDGHVFRFLALIELGDLEGADAALADARAAARLPVSHWGVLQYESLRALLAGGLRLRTPCRPSALGRTRHVPGEADPDPWHHRAGDGRCPVVTICCASGRRRCIRWSPRRLRRPGAPHQLLAPMQRQLELVQEVVERGRRLQQELLTRTFARRARKD